MHVSPLAYSRLSKAVGALVTLMGASLLGAYAVFVATGTNPVTASLPGIGAVGEMAFASMGAFALSVGGFVLSGGPDVQGRVRIAAVALGLVAAVRLLAFTDAPTRLVVGSAPLIEFFVLGAIAAAALLVRPTPAAPVGELVGDPKVRC